MQIKRSHQLSIVLFSLLLLALVIPVPELGRELDNILDMLHTPIFALLGFALFLFLHKRVKFSNGRLMLLCWVSVFSFGVFIEVAQPLIGRSASWQDIWADGCGALAGVIWAAWFVSPVTRRTAPTVIAVGVVLLFGTARPLVEIFDAARQRWEMPQLASFESQLELTRWSGLAQRIERTNDHATHGSWSIRVDLLPSKYPSLTMVHPVPDWSSYDELVFDIFVTSQRFHLIIKIEDRQHNGEYFDRFHQVERLPPGRHEIRVALSGVRAAPRDREMDLRQITALSLFMDGPKTKKTFFVDNFRLQ